MEIKHTPGPWEFSGKTDNFAITPAASRGNGWIGDRYLRASGCMDIHDARLIAAAPDLLSAARQALEECADLMATPAGDALAAAILKAIGSEE